MHDGSGGKTRAKKYLLYGPYSPNRVRNENAPHAQPGRQKMTSQAKAAAAHSDSIRILFRKTTGAHGRGFGVWPRFRLERVINLNVGSLFAYVCSLLKKTEAWMFSSMGCGLILNFASPLFLEEAVEPSGILGTRVKS